MRSFIRIVYAMAFAASSLPVSAADYPARAVTIIVPSAAGSAVDAAARILAGSLAGQLQRPFVVQNVPGAGSTIGAAQAARAKPDGHTLFFGGSSANAMAPHLYAQPGYQALASFAPISLVCATPFVVVVPFHSPMRSLEDLVGRIKSEPNQLAFGSTGSGSAPHLVAELFLRATETQARHIPYSSATGALIALANGDIDFSFDTPITSGPMIQNGRIRALAVTGSARWADHPEVRTFEESGYGDFQALAWTALYAPAGTPAGVIDTLNQNVKQALSNPEIAMRYQKIGFAAMPGSASELADYTRREYEKWRRIVADLAVRPN